MQSELEILTLVGPDGVEVDHAVLAVVEDERGTMLVVCPQAALDGDPDTTLALRVLRVHETRRGLDLQDEADPERAAWAVAVAEESLLEG